MTLHPVPGTGRKRGGAGGARGRRRRGAWRRAGASGGTAARGRRTIASPCRRPPAPAGGPGPSGAGGPAGLWAGPESPPPRPAPWQPRPLSVLGAAPRPGVADLPPGELCGGSAAGSRPPPPSAWSLSRQWSQRRESINYNCSQGSRLVDDDSTTFDFTCQ
ncbi:unnamed protein product [Nyctereutes procyonoides]|uniref:(raccoon dog) hypothetical protein n=1 Tax=Nyctereutes procyonoides TaxID=34880 RepID=A0A811Y1D1_NYCPR|nr:unnamed protein product [Nyctereutes procyonoides]